MFFGQTGSPGVPPAGAEGGDAPGLPKWSREPLEEGMLLVCLNSSHSIWAGQEHPLLWWLPTDQPGLSQAG